MGRSKGLAPWAWIYKDPFDHERHQAWARARAQAHFIGAVWEIEIDEWFEIWTSELWARRGRATDQLCMIRIDRTLPFRRDNVMLVTRYEQITRDKKQHRKTEKQI
jgi:hypothetical protein